MRYTPYFPLEVTASTGAIPDQVTGYYSGRLNAMLSQQLGITVDFMFTVDTYVYTYTMAGWLAGCTYNAVPMLCCAVLFYVVPCYTHLRRSLLYNYTIIHDYT